MSNLTLKKYLAPARFYKRMAMVGLPIMVQQMLNSIMGIVDSIMVSSINGVSAVGNATQIENLMMTISFGAASGASIFIAQYFGAKDQTNQRKSFIVGVSFTLMIALGMLTLASFFPETLMRFFIDDAEVIERSLIYLNIVKWSYIPFVITMMFSFAYRSIQRTMISLGIGIFAMITNVTLNALLIFGLFGFPALGIQGAAIATLIAHSLSAIIHVVYAVVTKQPFFSFKLKDMIVESPLVKKISSRAVPLMFNELFFGVGMTLFIRFYGMYGPESLESYYVANQLSMFFFFAIMGVNAASSAILGAILGEGKLEEAEQTMHYFYGVGVFLAVVLSIAVLVLAPWLVNLYGSGVSNPALATTILRILSLRLALRVFNVLIFSALRAGGDAKFLTWLDAGLVWGIGLPLTAFLVMVVKIESLAVVLLLVQVEQIVRVVIGLIRVSKGRWLMNLTR
ncbi:MAG: MATE family efflux transporter [Erysipelothrix sp.]|jgi:putative MATE family efflux protein|nr:MATE family efflux transporter [Erysipelothrix sp.]